MSVEVHRVPARLLNGVWPAISDFAERACMDHPFLDGGDLFHVAMAGKAQVFIATSHEGVIGFGATEMVDYPRHRVANILAIGGKRGFLRAAYAPLYRELEKWAIEFGADTLAAIGARPGWLKFARQERGETQTLFVAWKTIHGERRRRDNATGHGTVGSTTATPS